MARSRSKKQPYVSKAERARREAAKKKLPGFSKDHTAWYEAKQSVDFKMNKYDRQIDEMHGQWNDLDKKFTEVKNNNVWTSPPKGVKQPKTLKSKAIGIGFGVGMAIDTISNMSDGDDFGTAAVKGAFTGMLYTTMPQIMLAKDLAGMAADGYQAYYNWNREQKQWWNQQFSPNFGGGYQDSRRALTMRQAAVQAIQGSKLNARSALGGEAQLLYQNFNRG